MDHFSQDNRIKFSWDNRRRDGRRSLARLNRCYSFQQVRAGPSPIIKYLIRGDCSHADHLPVEHSVQLLPDGPKRSTYKMSNAHLNDPEALVTIPRIWRQHPSLGFTGKLRRVTKFYKQLCIRSAKARRETEARLRRDLSSLNAALHVDPLNHGLQENLAIVTNSLAVLEQQMAEGQRVRSRVKWIKVGDSCSKEFFQASKPHTGASRISVLQDEHGTLKTDQPSLEAISSSFYSRLYTAQGRTLAQEEAAHWILESTGDKLTASMKDNLTRPFTEAELSEALKGLSFGKAPGPDGVTTEFFKKHWELMKTDYLSMINKAIIDKKLPPGVTKGLITLIYKSGEGTSLANWRPITLLNTAYKVFAKALQARLQPVLMEIIDPDQSTFLPLRFILDNIMLSHETIEWAEHTKQPLIFLKLDFSKAFDIVDWNFLLWAMAVIGIPHGFIAMTEMLLVDTQVVVKINRSHSPAFPIRRGVR